MCLHRFGIYLTEMSVYFRLFIIKSHMTHMVNNRAKLTELNLALVW